MACLWNLFFNIRTDERVNLFSNTSTLGRDGNGTLGRDGNGTLGRDGNGTLGRDGNGALGRDGSGSGSSSGVTAALDKKATFISILPPRRFFAGIKSTQSKPDAVWLNLEGEMMRAMVVDVLDGNTVALVFQLGRKNWKVVCRLRNINVSEIRKDMKNVCKSTNMLREQVLNRKVWIECGNWDKNGNLLGIIYQTSNFTTSVNEELLNSGLATA
jgi:endonuclease YncB( thermonuclease family)